jgi:DNA polymerase II large subunit
VALFALIEDLRHERAHVILDVGEILISFGEFLENNHPLVPSAYCEEWWILEAGKRHPENEEEAIGFARNGAPLHPDYTWIWDDLTCDQIHKLADIVSENGTIRANGLELPLIQETMNTIEKQLLAVKEDI